MSNSVTGNATPYYGTTVGDWDTITIGPFVLSNTKIVVSGDTEYKIDVKPAPGLDGARETPIGYIPAKIRVTVELWNDQLLGAWALLIGAYKPKPSKTKPVPVTVDHPLLRMMALTRFYVVGAPVPKALGSQKYEGELHLVEYFAAPKASGTQAPTIAAQPVIGGGAPTLSEPGQSFESQAPKLTAPSQNNTGPT